MKRSEFERENMDKISIIKKIIHEELKKVALTEAFKSTKLTKMVNLAGGASKWDGNLIKRVGRGIKWLPSVNWAEISDDDVTVKDSESAKSFMKDENIIFWITTEPRTMTDKTSVGRSYHVSGRIVYPEPFKFTFPIGLVAATVGKNIYGLSGAFDRYRREAGLGTAAAIMKISDIAFILNINDLKTKYSTADIQKGRAEARSGALALQDLRKVKDANLLRYKNAIRNKMAKDEPIDVQVSKLIADMNVILTDAIKNPQYDERGRVTIPGWPSSWGGGPANVMSDFKDLLQNYEEYLNYKKEYEKEKDADPSTSLPSWYAREVKSKTAYVLDKIRELKSKVDKLKNTNA